MCSQEGSELGWLIDPADEAIVIVAPVQQVSIIRGDRHLPILEEIDLNLTANDIFAWLTI